MTMVINTPQLLYRLHNIMNANSMYIKPHLTYHYKLFILSKPHSSAIRSQRADNTKLECNLPMQAPKLMCKPNNFKAYLVSVLADIFISKLRLAHRSNHKERRGQFFMIISFILQIIWWITKLF